MHQVTSPDSTVPQERFGNLPRDLMRRKYSFVIKQPTVLPQPDDWSGCRYLAYQLERIGNDDSTKRLIGIMEFTRPIRWITLKKEHPELSKAFFGDVIGREAFRKYYLSDDKISPSGKGVYKRIAGPMEWGDWNAGGQGRKRDSDEEEPYVE